MKSVAITFLAGLPIYFPFFFWWVVGLILIIFGIKSKTTWLRAVLIFLALLAVGKPVWDKHSKYETARTGYELAKKECEQIGGFHGEKNLPFISDSALLIDDWAKDRYYFGMYDAGRLLLQNHLKHVEVKQKYKSPGVPFYGYSEKYLEGVEGEGEYFVFTLSNADDPACKAFEIQSRHSLDSYRAMGLPPGQCIAVHRAKNTYAKVTVHREGGIKRSQITYEFDRFTIVDNNNPQKMVENYRFAYYGLNPYFSNEFTVNCEGNKKGTPYFADLLSKGIFGEEHAKFLEVQATIMSKYQNASSTFRNAVELAKVSDKPEERQAVVDAFNASVGASPDTLREYAKSNLYIVRWAVAQNRNAPPDVLKTLISDISPDVSQAATESLKTFHPGK